MSKTKEQRFSEIHAQALTEFDEIQSAQRQERLQCLEDRRFYSIAGAQWEGALGDQFENKPRFEVNKVHLAVIRVINEYRNNRISVEFIPKDGAKNDKLADACAGLYRADEQDSTAEEAYDNAFEEAVGGGFGAWRLRACYEDEDDDEDERQRIVIEPIHDADSCVFFDLGAKRQDKADATRCFVLTGMTRAAYIAEWDDDPTDWDKDITLRQFDWCAGDIVYIAEYYRVEEKTEVVHVYRGIDDEDMMVSDAELRDDPTKEEVLLATGFREVRQKRIKRKTVRKYILSGGRVLADEGVIAGQCIPIVPVYGKRWYVDGVERCMGHVRLAKDAQRLKNMQVSNLGDLAAMSAREKPIVTPEQMAGHATMWANDNVEQYPYLMLNAMHDADGNAMPSGPIAYTKPPVIPPALAALLQISEQDMQDVLGNQQAGEQVQPNISGKAIELVQNRLDMQAFIYVSNMNKAVRRSGQIWLSMAKDIIVEDSRKMKIVEASGDTGAVVLNQPSVNPETQEQIIQNNISEAKFQVTAETGPSSVSRRAATVRALTGMMQITQDPETLSVLSSMAMMNMEGEGIGEVRDFFRKKLLAIGAVKPTEEEAAEMADAAQGQQPGPQEQYLMAAAEEATASAAQERAKTVETIASADLKRAQTKKTLVEAGKTDQDGQLAALQQLQGMLSQQAPTVAPPNLPPMVDAQPADPFNSP